MMGCVQSTELSFDDVNKSVNKLNGGYSSQPSTPEHEFLSFDEKKTILSDWERLRAVNHQQMGMRIFLRIFELEPSAKDTFDAFRHLEGADLAQNTMFRCHAARFMRAVAVAIDNLDALDVIVIPNLIQLGRIHRSVPGLGRPHLDAFEQAMSEVWTSELSGKDRPEDVEKKSATAWGKVFRLITSKVFEGYLENSQSGSPVNRTNGQAAMNGSAVCMPASEK